jgi:hypothetical protein
MTKGLPDKVQSYFVILRTSTQAPHSSRPRNCENGLRLLAPPLDLLHVTLSGDLGPILWERHILDINDVEFKDFCPPNS